MYQTHVWQSAEWRCASAEETTLTWLEETLRRRLTFIYKSSVLGNKSAQRSTQRFPPYLLAVHSDLLRERLKCDFSAFTHVMWWLITDLPVSNANGLRHNQTGILKAPLKSPRYRRCCYFEEMVSSQKLESWGLLSWRHNDSSITGIFLSI